MSDVWNRNHVIAATMLMVLVAATVSLLIKLAAKHGIATSSLNEISITVPDNYQGFIYLIENSGAPVAKPSQEVIDCTSYSIVSVDSIKSFEHWHTYIVTTPSGNQYKHEMGYFGNPGDLKDVPHSDLIVVDMGIGHQENGGSAIVKLYVGQAGMLKENLDYINQFDFAELINNPELLIYLAP